MPDPSSSAVEALRSPGRIGRRTAALRIVTGAVLALTALGVQGTTSPEPVAAGSSCTGWTSHASPPRTIRVLETKTGKVRTVAFRKYVGQVMASGEWPARLKMATLEAGAVATKQYAWYYAMKGHHRKHYVSRGQCYDVDDTVVDQLYRSWAKPTTKQLKAVESTWNLTVRKKGRFFLTGYRAGTAGRCAADANGWKLYARSVNACAKQGWSSTRILKRYLSPNLKLVRSRTMGPVLTKPTLKLRTGNVLPGAATTDWKRMSYRDEIGKYQLQRKTGKGQWKSIELPARRAKTADVWLKTGSTNVFRVRAKDTQGNFGPWAHSPTRRASLRGPKGISLSGAGAHVASAQAQRVKVRVKGRSAAFVTRVGPGMGRAKIFVNGKKVAVVNLDREQTVKRKLVWAKNWARVKERVIVVRPANATERVDFHGIFTLR